jgi:hypothetical protein
MITKACAIVLAASLAGCTIRADVPSGYRSPPPPRAEPAPAPVAAPAPAPTTPPPPPGPYAHLPQRASFEAKGNVKLQEGLYRGDFRLTASAAGLEGAGKEKTIIDGNLFIKTQCTVKSLTVLGKVVFLGNQNDLKDVDFRGGIEDKGVQNRYQ